MKSISKNFRSFVVSLFLVLIVSTVGSLPAFSGPAEIDNAEVTAVNICPDCYIVYVWIEHVRWAQVYSADGSMIDMYEDPED